MSCAMAPEVLAIATLSDLAHSLQLRKEVWRVLPACTSIDNINQGTCLVTKAVLLSQQGRI